MKNVGVVESAATQQNGEAISSRRGFTGFNIVLRQVEDGSPSSQLERREENYQVKF